MSEMDLAVWPGPGSWLSLTFMTVQPPSLHVVGPIGESVPGSADVLKGRTSVSTEVKTDFPEAGPSRGSSLSIEADPSRNCEWALLSASSALSQLRTFSPATTQIC